MFDAKKVKDDIVAWIQDYFKANGDGCKAVVGISGGKDSTVTATLCAAALGKERVIGVLLPNGEQPDIDFSYAVIRELGITMRYFDISGAVDAILSQFRSDASQQTRVNLPPRIRMATLYAVSQSENGRVANTCNLSEEWIGYSTRYGDSVGDFSPLSQLTSDEVIAVGRALGVSESLLLKPPSDGLTGRTDEEAFGFSYTVLNRYIRTGVCEDETVKQTIDRLHEKNHFKQLPMPAFPYS